MKKWSELALGIVTSIGGFLEVGSIATSAQGGPRALRRADELPRLD